MTLIVKKHPHALHLKGPFVSCATTSLRGVRGGILNLIIPCSLLQRFLMTSFLRKQESSQGSLDSGSSPE